MNVSSISTNSNPIRRNLFIQYANSFFGGNVISGNEESDGEISPMPPTKPDKKIDKSKGIETLTIFPKEIIDGKTIITA